jgi:hypothetical protein
MKQTSLLLKMKFICVIIREIQRAISNAVSACQIPDVCKAAEM